MMDDGGFFEELNIDDVEEVELFSVEEEEFDSFEDYEKSAVSEDIEGVLREVEVEEGNHVGSDQISNNEDLTDIASGSEPLRVIYVNKSTLQTYPQTVSGCQVVLLDNSQFDVLIDEISSLKSDPVVVQTVSQNDYYAELHSLNETVQGSLLVNIILFALCFGYTVKETVFRGA